MVPGSLDSEAVLVTITLNNPSFAFQVLGEGRIGLTDKEVTTFHSALLQCGCSNNLLWEHRARSTELHELGKIFPGAERFGLILTDQ